jgi:hypothetical protein
MGLDIQRIAGIDGNKKDVTDLEDMGTRPRMEVQRQGTQIERTTNSATRKYLGLWERWISCLKENEMDAVFKEFKASEPDQLESMMLWEEGELDGDATIKLFQGLIDSGLAWELQGMYGRSAQKLIEMGLCHEATPHVMFD